MQLLSFSAFLSAYGAAESYCYELLETSGKPAISEAEIVNASMKADQLKSLKAYISLLRYSMGLGNASEISLAVCQWTS